MLTQYRISLARDETRPARAEWGYCLYAALLKYAPPDFAERVHGAAFTPVSQSLRVGGDGDPLWVVNLLGRDSEDALSGYLDSLRTVTLTRERVALRVLRKERRFIPDVEAALSLPGARTLRFLTPTAFKSRELYRNFPDSRLILQSLIKKWNGCFPECPIEDEDGEGVETLADGLLFRRFRIQDRAYRLKRNDIPGFVGELWIENRLRGFQRRLADALLTFSGFSGVGMKTALGMGGVDTGFSRES